MNIYNITNEYQLLINQIIDAEGELSPEMDLSLQINKSQLETKSTNYAYVIKQLDFDCEQIDAEIKRLNSLKKIRTNLSERLKNTISDAMNLYEVEKIETSLIKLSFRNSESVEITNESQLSEKFVVTKMVTTPDKKAIKDAIKNGEFVEGATINFNKNLQIK